MSDITKHALEASLKHMLLKKTAKQDYHQRYRRRLWH